MVQNMEHEKLVYGVNSWKEKKVNGSWCLGCNLGFRVEGLGK